MCINRSFLYFHNPLNNLFLNKILRKLNTYRKHRISLFTVYKDVCIAFEISAVWANFVSVAEKQGMFSCHENPCSRIAGGG